MIRQNLETKIDSKLFYAKDMQEYAGFTLLMTMVYWTINIMHTWCTVVMRSQCKEWFSEEKKLISKFILTRKICQWYQNKQNLLQMEDDFYISYSNGRYLLLFLSIKSLRFEVLKF